MTNIAGRKILGGALTPVYVAGGNPDSPLEITIAGGDPDNPVSQIVVGIAVPAGDPVVGQAVIAVTGTAVRLSAVSVELPTASVLVYAKGSNNATGGTVGAAGVTNAVNGTGNGYILESGQSVVIMTDNVNLVWVNGTAGDIFCWSAG